MESQFIPLTETSLAIDGLEILDDEMILIRGGFSAVSGGSGCGCGCDCASGKGCGCGCGSGQGCGCSCSAPTVAPDN